MAVRKFDHDKFVLELSERLKEVSRAPNIGKYKPHAKQFIFHSSNKKRKLYIGGNRSGKTVGGVCEGIWRATGTHPYRPELNALGPTRGRVVGVDFTQGIDKIIIPIYKQWCKPSMLRGGSWDNAYDKAGRTLNFANGSTIEFMSYDQDLDKFAGTSRHWVHFDEEPPKSIYEECRARLIDTNGEFFMTMTPVEGMTWIYEDLYEPNVGKEDGSVLVIEINTLENPYLSSDALEEFAKDTDDDQIAVRIGGAFVQQGGRVYKNFDPTPGALQVLPNEWNLNDHEIRLKDLFPPRQWLHAICLDHGLNNPTAVYWAAFNEDGFGFIYDEHYRKEWGIDQHAAEIQARNIKHGIMPSLWVADPSIVNRNAITMTSVQEEYQKYGISWMTGNNDVKAGIIRVRKYLNPHKLVRRGYNHPLFTYDLSVKDKNTLAMAGNGATPPVDLPGVMRFCKLRFFPNCVEAIKEAKRYRWKTYANKKLQFENNPYDEPHKKDDHAMDAIRYLIMSQPDISAENENLMEQVRDGLSANNVDSLLDKITMANSGVADPNGLLDPNNPWQSGNDIPTSYGSDGWQYDEHMGGVW